MMSKKESHLVKFAGEGLIMVAEGQSLLEAALLAGIPMYHACGGQAKCSTCRVLVLEGYYSLSLPTEREKMLKTKMRFPPNVRLACQTHVEGKDVDLSRIIRDESDINLYVGIDAGEATQKLGEEKELVMFFLDIRNFTTFVESHPPFDIIHIVRKLFTTFQKSIELHRGRIIETSGDGFYAVFGFEGELHRAVASALKAGFTILIDLEKLNESYFRKYFGQHIQIGIGVHAGLTVGGNIRLGNESHMVVMGHAVNIASRLQNATKELNNSFILSSDAFNLLRITLAEHETTSIHLKGISKPMKVHLVGKPYLAEE